MPRQNSAAVDFGGSLRFSLAVHRRQRRAKRQLAHAVDAAGSGAQEQGSVEALPLDRSPVLGDCEVPRGYGARVVRVHSVQ